MVVMTASIEVKHANVLITRGGDGTALAGSGASPGPPLDEFYDDEFPALQRGDTDTVSFGPTDTPEFNQMLGASAPLFKARL